MPRIEKSHDRPWLPKLQPFSRYSAKNAAFYHSAEWKKVRDLQLMQHPICQECERLGRVTPATVVDHIKPINEGGDRLDQRNLQSLCETCHNRKSAREGRAVRLCPPLSAPRQTNENNNP